MHKHARTIKNKIFVCLIMEIGCVYQVHSDGLHARAGHMHSCSHTDTHTRTRREETRFKFNNTIPIHKRINVL